MLASFGFRARRSCRRPVFRPSGTPSELDAAGDLTNVYTSNGSASGVGDITVRVKGNVFTNENLGIALGVDVRTPTGSARKFLGSGAWGLRPFVAVSGHRRVSPHVNLGFGWNGESILAGNITGTTIGETRAAIPPLRMGLL